MGFMAYADWLSSQFDAVPSVRARTVAAQAGITEGYLSALRSGRNERPSNERADRIARVFAQLRGLSDAETEALVAEVVQLIGNSEAAEVRSTSPLPATSKRSGTRFRDVPTTLESFGDYCRYLAAYNAR